MSELHKVKLGEIIGVRFERAVQALMSKELDVVTSFKLAATQNQIKEHQANWSEQRLKLLQKFTEKTEDGRMAVDEQGEEFAFSTENREAFDQEYAKLTAIEVEISPIAISDLQGIRLAPEAMAELAGKVIVP